MLRARRARRGATRWVAAKVVGSLLVALATVPASGASASTIPGGIQLGLAFDYQATNTAAVASNVDYVWGGHFLDWDFGAYPSVPNQDGYMPFDADPWPQSSPGHSLAWYQANHPDWVVYQCDGTTPAYYGDGYTNVPLDFTNPAVRAWQLQQAASLLEAGATGVGFDNFTFANYKDACGVYKNGVWTPLGYPGNWQDNAKLNDDMLTWLEDVSSQLKQEFPTKTITVNFSTKLSGLANLKAIVPYIDMDFDESGFMSWSGQPLSDAAWQQEVDGLEYLSAAGKAFDVNELVNAPNDQSITHGQLNWALANYLLVKGQRSYTYVYPDGGYGTFYDRPEYHIAIGTPTSARYQAQGVQMRDYSGGLAIVNPSSARTYTVTLPAAYTDMWGARYTTVTLPPTTGAVLLNTTTAIPGTARGAKLAGAKSRSGTRRAHRRHDKHRRHLRHHRVHSKHHRRQRPYRDLR